MGTGATARCVCRSVCHEKGSCIDRQPINTQCLGFELQQKPQGDLLRLVCNALQFNDIYPCFIESAVCLAADTSWALPWKTCGVTYPSIWDSIDIGHWSPIGPSSGAHSQFYASSPLCMCLKWLSITGLHYEHHQKWCVKYASPEPASDNSSFLPEETWVNQILKSYETF